MARESAGVERDWIVLDLLASLEQDGGKSQRHLASELGIALGLVNLYIKRCVKKGLVKVSEVPARRFAYYLTPQGFAEKSRLSVEYFSSSLSFFRHARADCGALLSAMKSEGWTRIVLAGTSDLAEIACLSALEHDVEIVAVVDPDGVAPVFVGRPVVRSFSAAEPFDAIVVTDLRSDLGTYDAAVRTVGAARVFVPKLLGLRHVSLLEQRK